MSSWAVLLGATGFKVDAPRGALAIVPAVPMPRFRAPWVSSTGWGAFEQTAGRFELECRSGTLAFRTLRLGLAGKTASVTLNGVPLRAAVCRDGATLVLSFSRPVTMKDGGRLTVA